MKGSKLKMRDVTTIGIFSALLVVITILIGAITGMSMHFYNFSVAFIALLSAPFYMLIVTKVHKPGAIIMTYSIVGILWAVMGGIFILIWMVILGIVGEFLVSKTNYQNLKMITVSYILYILAYYLGAVGPIYYYTEYVFSHGRTEEAANALISAAHTTGAYISIPIMIIAAIVGAVVARKLLKKHLKKAGVI